MRSGEAHTARRSGPRRRCFACPLMTEGGPPLALLVSVGSDPSRWLANVQSIGRLIASRRNGLEERAFLFIGSALRGFREIRMGEVYTMRCIVSVVALVL